MLNDRGKTHQEAVRMITDRRVDRVREMDSFPSGEDKQVGGWLAYMAAFYAHRAHEIAMSMEKMEGPRDRRALRSDQKKQLAEAGAFVLAELERVLRAEKEDVLL